VVHAGLVGRVRIFVAISAGAVMAALLYYVASLVGIATADVVTAPIIVAVTLILGEGMLTRLSYQIINGTARQTRMVFAGVSLFGILLAGTCWQSWDVVATAPGMVLAVGGLMGLLKCEGHQARSVSV
jgi:hypothetical protein